MRISKNMIAELLLFKEHECKAIEEYLEEKALEGWMLSHKSCGLFIFKKSPPVKCKFALDNFADNIKYGSIHEYIEYCEAGGWTYLCSSYGKFLIFYTKDENITPIHTDEDMIIKKMRKFILINMLLYIFTAIIWGFNLIFSLGYKFFILIPNNVCVILMMTLLVAGFLYISCTIRDGMWYFKSKKALKLGEDINYISCKSFKIRNSFAKVCISMLILIILSFRSLIGDEINNKAYIYISIFTFLLIIFIIKFINITLSKYKKVSKILGTIIFVVGVFLSANIFITGKNMVNYVGDPNKPVIMSINDFENIKIKNTNLYYARSESFLASDYKYYYDKFINVEDYDYFSQHSKGYFKYEICKSKYEWVLDKIFNSYLKLYKYQDFVEVKDKDWGAIKVYKDNKSKDGYILRYKDRVICVSGSIDFTKENKKFIKDKCLEWE
ncbi:MAG: DUF2812 domain-containing protein [Terrisporobacter othiniensis]|uniref:DUF2812 domain-containing protein n=1 Tax=Terrisporobacter petrolearius TaxID=1460447 RepID=UPI0022E55B77|nr:DUF2812 domain-containing protein [Terrisporobacter petrolearius]MDU4860949.1 DUF2812 domain-containing protein [Terrisporobacter othiniensis]MDU6993527.1 DUF2812 domain-containing protein [Terrisporobacter othiniensis]